MASEKLFIVRSTAFKDSGEILMLHTCEDANSSPDLEWDGVPEGVKSFAVICDDPDAPTEKPWIHWVIYNIPATRRKLPEDLGSRPSFDDGTMQGLNSFDTIGYDGPCPPSGENHRYFFRLYALNTILKQEPGLTQEQLMNAMESHIIAQTYIMGTYEMLHKND